MNNPIRLAQRRSILSLILAGFLLLLFIGTSIFMAGQKPIPVRAAAGSNASALTTSDAITNTLFLSLLSGSTAPPTIELLNAFSGDALGNERPVFLAGAPLVYYISGTQSLTSTLHAGLRINQAGPCGGSQVYSNTVALPSGDWLHGVPSQAQDCTGVFTTTTQLSYKTYSSTLESRHIVNLPSTVITSTEQAFDLCTTPGVSQMQSWWDSSPYSVFNLYIGGIHYACKSKPLDPYWVHQVAKQGWTYILTWVGPQAPCSGYTYKISYNTTTAYKQGKTEASAAADAARNLGFLADQIIYYDMEAYTDSASCRAAVDSFMTGWAEQLHALKLKAGGYGSPARSYLADWSDNTPPPDDVWIAHWLLPAAYDADATVWTPYMSDTLWPNHQRLRQYAGGHAETWGGVKLTIDSNVLDGEITALPFTTTLPAQGAAEVVVSRYGTPVGDLGLHSASQGWVQAEDRLRVTEDGGVSWQDITPPGMRVMAADFSDALLGWAVGYVASSSELQSAHTGDGGLTWQFAALPAGNLFSTEEVVAASFDLVDNTTAWLALKLPSGSSFSLGRLLLTQDGGRTWQERSVPLSEPVEFRDALQGWTAGGPAGDQLYVTSDGGRTWQLQNLALPAGDIPSIGLPRFSGALHGWLPVTLRAPLGDRLARFVTRDGGQSWQLDTITSLGAGLPAAEILTADPEAGLELLPASLPAGVVAADFLNRRSGWVVTQEGSCAGGKLNPLAGATPGDSQLRCTQVWRLLATQDGGSTWQEIGW